MAVTVSRKAHFNAAHRLYRPDWDNKKMKKFSASAIIHFIMDTIMS